MRAAESTAEVLEQRLLLVLETIAVRDPGLTISEAIPVIVHALKNVHWSPAGSNAIGLSLAVVEFIKNRQKIEAIKQHRLETGASPLEAKNAVEAVEDEMRRAGEL